MSSSTVGKTAGSKDLVVIGKISKPHGLRGEVCVLSYADSPSLFEHVKTVFLRPEVQELQEDDSRQQRGRGGRGRRPQRPRRPRLRRVKVSAWRVHKGSVLVTFDTVDGRNEAEAIRGHEVLVPESALPELTDDELYLYQIEGLEVRLEGGEVLGNVREVMMPAGQEIWAIDTPEGKEVMFPVAEEFILAVDLDEGFVEIVPPPGLLDLYLGED